jgi:hypothetical protein
MLTFGYLGADAALTEVFQDNHASQGVSRKLGHEPDGISRDAIGGEAVVSDRLRLTRQKWQSQPRAGVTVAGFAAAAPCSACDTSPIRRRHGEPRTPAFPRTPCHAADGVCRQRRAALRRKTTSTMAPSPMVSARCTAT